MVESGEADRPTKTLSHLGQANPCRPISPSRRRFREPATAACSAGSICRRVSGGVAAAIRAPAKTDREGDHRLGSRAARRGCAQFRLSQREVQAKGSVEAIFWAIAHARDAPKPTAPILGQAGRAELPGTDLRNTHRSRRGGQIPAGSISPDTGLRRSMPQAAGEAFFHAFRPLSDENGGLNGTDCAVRFRAAFTRVIHQEPMQFLYSLPLARPRETSNILPMMWFRWGVKTCSTFSIPTICRN